MLAAVARLPLRTREIMALRYYLDLPQDEIAALFGVCRGTVSSTISRALATLSRDLQENLEQAGGASARRLPRRGRRGGCAGDGP